MENETYKNVTIGVLIAAICLLVTYIYAATEKPHALSSDVWQGLVLGGLSSVLASLTIFIAFRPKNNSLTSDHVDVIAESIAQRLHQTNNPFLLQVHRVDRNLNMGERYWISVIEELDTAPGKVMFSGKTMLLWLDAPYRSTLQAKLTQRAKNAAVYSNRGKYATSIALTDRNALVTWKKFLASILKSAGDKTEAECGFSLTVQATDNPAYSGVCCARRMAITTYLSEGRSQSSPTFDVIENSVLWHLYFDDMSRVADGITTKS